MLAARPNDYRFLLLRRGQRKFAPIFMGAFFPLSMASQHSPAQSGAIHARGLLDKVARSPALTAPYASV